jgi:hypothetical protein
MLKNKFTFCAKSILGTVLVLSVLAPAHASEGDGGGTPPDNNTSTVALPFGDMQVGTPSLAKTVTLTNVGNGPLFYYGAAIAGTHPSNFAIQTDGCTGSELPVGSNCQLQVTFTPSALSAKSATLVLSNGTRTGKSKITQTVLLTGFGVAPAASVTPASLSFGNQLVGVSSASQTVTLSNTGTAPMSFTSVTLTNPAAFSLSHNCPAVLDVPTLTGGISSCTINVTFNPGSLGAKSSILKIQDEAGTQTVTLSGVGVP